MGIERLTFDQLYQAVSDANRTLETADRLIGHMADILKGRLRHVPYTQLCALKRELRDFNMHTGTWKS